jgi:serine/threonine-protein kinase
MCVRYCEKGLHASGNLGDVYEADDLEIKRVVALKRLKAGRTGDLSLRAQFLLEGEITGRLEHPGVVPVYGMGKTPAGDDYYAMRFIRGETFWDAIQDFHNARARLDPGDRQLELRRLLNRFVDVCEAIAYAHSRGILHLDLKPQNVMLGKYGETLVVDWGLAKAVGHSDPTAGELTLVPETAGMDAIVNQPGRIFGTREYMSPEHVSGDPNRLAPQSDVYSLGAMLSLLLTGKLRFENRGVVATIDAISKGDFPRPHQLKPSIDPALDAVCMKAMALQLDDRYPSARALADDVERWLADEPVSAYRERLARRARRWARRHRSIVTGAAAILLTFSLALGVGFFLVNHERLRALEAEAQAKKAEIAANEAREEAEEHLRIGLGAVEQLVRLGDQQLITPKEVTDTREQLLSESVRFVGYFRQRHSADPNLEAESAQVARRLANLYRLRGEFDRASRLYDQSRSLIDDLVGRHPRHRDYRDLQAEILLDAGESLNMSGRMGDAEKRFQEAHAIASELSSGTPPDSPYRRTHARSLFRLASIGLDYGRPDSLPTAESARDELRPLADASRKTIRNAGANLSLLAFSDQIEFVFAQTVLAEASRRSGKVSEAERELRDGLERLSFLVERFKSSRIDDLTRDFPDAR